jgi:hypothetical protein
MFLESLLKVLKEDKDTGVYQSAVCTLGKLSCTKNVFSQLQHWCSVNYTANLNNETWETEFAHRIFSFVDKDTLDKSVPLVCNRWLFWQRSYLENYKKAAQEKALETLQLVDPVNTNSTNNNNSVSENSVETSSEVFFSRFEFKK